MPFIHSQPMDFSGAGESIGNAITKARQLRQQQELQRQKLALQAQSAQGRSDLQSAQTEYTKARAQTESQKQIEMVSRILARSDLGRGFGAMTQTPGTEGGPIGAPTQGQAAMYEGVKGLANIGNNPNEMANALKTILAIQSSGVATNPVLGADVVTGTRLNPVKAGPDGSTVITPNPNAATPVLAETPVRLGANQTLETQQGDVIGRGIVNTPSGAQSTLPTGETINNPKSESERMGLALPAALRVLQGSPGMGQSEQDVAKSNPIAFQAATNIISQVQQAMKRQAETKSDGSRTPNPAAGERKTQGAGTGTPDDNKVMVQDPQGKKFWLPASQLNEAIQQGYKKVSQ